MRVLIVDQHGQSIGTDNAPPMLVEAYTDPEGVVWTPPSAWAYWRACEARNAWADRCHDAERFLAALVDATKGSDGLDHVNARVAAEAFLKTKMGARP